MPVSYTHLVPEEEPELLSNIVRIFKDIPENCTVDIFEMCIRDRSQGDLALVHQLQDVGDQVGESDVALDLVAAVR